MITDSKYIKKNNAKPQWFQDTQKYSVPDSRKAIIQLINTFIPYFILIGLMIYTIKHDYSYWSTLAISIPAAGLLVRVFIIFHDCCHNSFFNSTKINKIIGNIAGVMAFTPFKDWRFAHATHHATAGDLDRRGIGDLWTMTVDEYKNSSLKKRFSYRCFRNPITLFIIGPILLFSLGNRFSTKGARKIEVHNVIATNIVLVGIACFFSAFFGFKTYLLVQSPILILASSIGVWMFYIQHQFPSVYWSRTVACDRFKVAIEGSSYYKLPKVLQWFTGNIGLHHIHHVRAQIPNYNLQRCYDETSDLQKVFAVTLLQSFKFSKLHLWDESKKQLISFRELI